jgi:hypothetical protein
MPGTGATTTDAVSSESVACSIVAKADLAQARVTATTFRRHNPGVPFEVLLADRIDGAFDPELEPFPLVEIESIPLPDRRRFLFMHRANELAYAATPYWLRDLLERGYRRVLFLKQETMVLNSLEPLFARLADAPILLTPHLTAPAGTADGLDRERTVLLAGSYNGGVLGVSRSATARDFLDWWASRLAGGCRHDVASGWHFEQRWLDLVPAYFPDAAIARDPGFNSGHWTLPERRVERDGDSYRIDGAPLRVFRFSGFDPDRPDAVTRYSDRLRVAELGAARGLFERFEVSLAESGRAAARALPYAFSRFDNGVPIPDVAREIYRDLGSAAARFDDPFAAGGADSFFRYLAERADAPSAGAGFPSRIWDAIWRRRADLRAAFPEPGGAHRAAYLAWTANSGLAEHAIDPAFLVRLPA